MEFSRIFGNSLHSQHFSTFSMRRNYSTRHVENHWKRHVQNYSTQHVENYSTHQVPTLANSTDWLKARKVGNTFLLHKAPGPDGIYPICLQEWLDLIIKNLINVYRGSVATGHILKLWRDVRVDLIPKPVRGLSLMKFYHPISHSFFMLKTIKELMERFLREGTLFSHSQLLGGGGKAPSFFGFDFSLAAKNQSLIYFS